MGSGNGHGGVSARIRALALEHLCPGITQCGQMTARFDDALALLVKIALEETAVHVLVEAAERLGEFPATLQIQRHVQLVQDFLRALNIVMDGLVCFSRIIDSEAGLGSFEEADRSLEEHEDDLSRRSGLHCDLAI